MPDSVTLRPSLRPVTGSPREVEELLRCWLATPTRGSLTVRTSGSTGSPKDVVLSAAALTFAANATLARLGGPGGWLLALPVNYVAGLQVVLRAVLADASPVVLAEHPDLPAATAALDTDRRYLSVVPTQLYRWLASPSDRDALRRYDAVLVGGAATDPALLAAARAHGVAVVTTYGMSETCGGCVYDGVPLDGVAVDIDPAGGVRLGGPVLFDGYEGAPEATIEVLRDGWLQTSDIGRLDAAGRLEVLGRSDDVVMSGGVSISVPAVERRIASMPVVAGCAVVAVPDAEWGSRLVAYVVAAPGAHAPGLDAIRDDVAQAYPRSWAPRDVVVTDQLPMLESGKVDRLVLIARAVPRAAPTRREQPDPASTGPV